MTPDDREILRRIADEQFDDFEEHVRRSTSIEFLNAALLELRARRAHLAAELSNVAAAKRYLPQPEPRVSITG